MTVRTHRDKARFDSCLPSSFNSVSGAFEVARAACGDIDAASGSRKFQSLFKDVFVAGAVCGANVADREATFNDFFIHFESTADITGVNVKNTNLSCNHAADANVCQQMENLFDSWKGRAVITQSNLNSEHFRNHKQIAFDAAC